MQLYDDIAPRLKQVRAELCYTQKQIADAVGARTPSWKDNEVGKTIPGGKVLAGLSKLGVNIDWVLTGEGEMMISRPPSKALDGLLKALEGLVVERKLEISGKDYIPWYKIDQAATQQIKDFAYALANDAKNHSSQDYGAEFAMVAHYDVEASAGHGSVVEREPEIGKLAFRKAWITRKGLSAKDLMAIRIKGDSMSPTIRDASIALVDGSKHDFRDDGIYVLQYDGHLVAKRLQRDAIGGGVLIKSDNQAYETQKISRDKLDDLFIIGRVIWVGQEV